MKPRLITLAVGLLVVAGVVLATLPANWVALAIAERTGGKVLLADARGNVWSGNAIVALSMNDVTRALPGRVSWTVHARLPGAITIDLSDADLLGGPLEVRLEPGRTHLNAGDAEVPLALAVLLGPPINTVRPNGLAHLHWEAVTLGQGTTNTSGTLNLTDVSVEINPVRPLGDYRINWQFVAPELSWDLATTRGPLNLEARGAGVNPVRFAGRASIAPGVPPVTAQRLWPLMEALGPRVGDAVNINIGT